jgi:hypothetical protein
MNLTFNERLSAGLFQFTERTRQKLFVPGTGVLVNIITPLTLMVLVCWPIQLTGGDRL